MKENELINKNEKLQTLLKLESREIANGFNKARIEGEGTPQEVADRREEVFKSFLMKYFPFPYRIVKGNITDSYGSSSQSIDCLILNPTHPYTVDPLNQKASFIFADGVDYAIEIKPDLANESEIERALKQIRSVKKLRRARTGIVFEKKLNAEQLEYYKTIPSIVFAEKTYTEIEKLVEYIVKYYVDNHIPSIEQFDLLLVNERVLLYNFRPNSYISHSDWHGIYFWEGGQDVISTFLLELNKIPQSVPLINDGILEIYLRNNGPRELVSFTELNDLLSGL